MLTRPPAAHGVGGPVVAGSVVAGLVLTGLVLAGLVLAGLVLAGLVLAGSVAAGSAPAAALGPAGAPPAAARDEVGAIVVADARLTESSALAVSPRNPDLLYTVNDSGHEPVVYVVDASGGASSRVVGTTRLAGVGGPRLDPEALAVGADGLLWVADIGDNAGTRTDIALYSLRAPGRGDATVRPARYPLTYPRGLRDDAETLVADPATGAMWVVTKGWFGGSVFAVPDDLVAGRPNRLRLLGGVEVPLLVTDGTVLPGGHAAVLRTYVSAHVYTLPDWDRVGAFRLPRQPQGEALAAVRGGRSLLAGTEGSPTRIDLVDVPRRLTAALQQAAEEDAAAGSRVRCLRRPGHVRR